MKLDRYLVEGRRLQLAHRAGVRVCPRPLPAHDVGELRREAFQAVNSYTYEVAKISEVHRRSRGSFELVLSSDTKVPVGLTYSSVVCRLLSRRPP